MKIENLEVVDPRIKGEIARPYILIDVNVLSGATSNIAHYDFLGTRWFTQKYNAFTEYWTDDEAILSSGLFNSVFAGKYEPMVDVQLFILDTERDVPGNWGIPLRRARQLLRKYAPEWRLLMNDRDGQDGLVSWTPVRLHLSCMEPVEYKSGRNGRSCGMAAKGSALKDKVEFPMCEFHLTNHNSKQAAKRVSK